MITLGETSEFAAEVAFTLPLDSDPLTGLTGWSFTLGEVQIKLPGAGWVNVAVNKIVEKGFGRFCARLTSAQTITAGDVFIKVEVAGTQFYFGSDVIGEMGGDIPVNATGSVPFFMPNAVDPVNGAPLTGHSWVNGEVKVCLPDSSYVNATVGNIEEVGFGGYKLNLTAGQTVKRGKVFLYALVTGYQRFEGYNTILGVGSIPSITVPAINPVDPPLVRGDPGYKDHTAEALNRLCEQFRSGDFDYSLVTLDTLLDSEL